MMLIDDDERLCEPIVEELAKAATEAFGRVEVANRQCDKTKLAAIGYCFGGSTVQQLAFAGTDLKAVASFHGGLVTPKPEEVKAIKAQMLICNERPTTPLFRPRRSAATSATALDKNGGKDKYEFINYPKTRSTASPSPKPMKPPRSSISRSPITKRPMKRC